MYAVGIDVSKGKSTIAIISNGVLLDSPFDIEHSQDGFSFLLKKLDAFPKSQIKFVMEATGIFHFPILTKLLDFDFFVCVENAFLIKKYFDVSLRKVKNDKKDAIKLANYCYEKWDSLKKFSIQDSIYQDLQFLSRQYSQQISLKVKSKIYLNNLIELSFPRFSEPFNLETQYLFFLDVFEKYYHPDLVLSMSENDFIDDVSKIASQRGHRLGVRVGTFLYSLAKQTIPSRPLNKYTLLSVSSCVNCLRSLEKATDDIISQMDELAKNLPEFDVVSNMNGVGKKIRSRLIAEIGDIRKYKSANSLIASAGIDTPTYQSGTFKATNIHISKRGNKYLRKCGYEVMKSLKTIKPTNDSAVYDYIVKKEQEGKPLKVCKIAGLNKFLRIYYARVSEVYKNL